MTLSADDIRFDPSPTLSWNDAGDELTLFDSASECYFALNGAAAAIWCELAAGRSAAEAADALADRFDVSRAAIVGDIAAFVRDALDRQLLIAHA